MMRFGLYLLLVLALLLSACGGGGSSSSGTTTPPPVVTGTITVSQSEVNFAAPQFSAAPPSQTIRIDFDAPRVTAGTLPGERVPDWLAVDLRQTGNSRGELELTILDTDLEPGTQSTTIRLVSTNDSGTVSYDTVDIPINYTVEPITLLETSVSTLTVDVAPIQDPVTRTITLTGEGVSWTATNFDGRVINVSPTSGTVPAGGQEIEITVAPTRDIFPSQTSYIVTFFQVGTRRNSTTLDIELNFTDGVFTDPETLSFMATVGDVNAQTQMITLDSFGLTDAPQINWNASSNQNWLTVSPADGTIDTSGSNPEPSEITVSADPSGLDIGASRGVITFTNDVSDQIFNLPVKLVISERKVTSNRRGIALSTLSKTEATLDLTDSAGVEVPWQAASNAAWLSVTPSGAAGERLTLTADPDGLANNTLSEAVVTVTSPLNDISNSVTINVGLWKSDDAPEDVTLEVSSGIFGLPDTAVEDPVRPYIYILDHQGFETGDNITSSLSAYNVFTGEEIAGPIPTQISGQSELVLSDDGSFVFVVPVISNDIDLEFERFDAGELTRSDVFPIAGQILSGGSEFTRVNGVATILTGGGAAIDVNSGTVLTGLGSIFGNNLVASRNGVACINNTDATAFTPLNCYDVFGTGIPGEELASNRRNIAPIAESTEILGISPDGETVYGRTNLMGGALATDDNGVERFFLGENYKLFVSQSGLLGTINQDPNSEFLEYIFSVLNADGTLLGETRVADFVDVAGVFSGDESRLLILGDFADLMTQTLIFLDTPED